MKKLGAFLFISLDGYYEGQNRDISWHVHGEEENEYAVENLEKNNILLFGRITYDLMANFWQTPEAKKSEPEVAKLMTGSEKFVVSRTLKNPEWENTSVISGNIASEIRKIKQLSVKDIVILGSNSIMVQLAEADLIDQYEIMIDPVAIGSGKQLFSGITRRLNLELTNARKFKSGVVLLSYKPHSV